MREGQVSETARRVAAQRLRFERVHTSYGDALADERLARDIAGPSTRAGMMRQYLQARTRFFDRVVVDSLEAGIDQVVVGAAGYDGRALRYAKPGVRWFEIDHPATQQDKLRRLAALGVDFGHIGFIPADFDTDDLASRLLDAGLDSTRASIFLLEGVAVYLERATLESVLNQIRTVAGPGSLLAISLSVTGGSPARAATRAALGFALAALGEPTRSAVAPDEVQGLLAGAGWHPAETTATDIAERSRAAGLVLAEARAHS